MGQEEVFGGREEVRQEFSENLEVIICVDDLDILIHRAIHRGQAAISCLYYNSANYNISNMIRCQALCLILFRQMKLYFQCFVSCCWL